MPAWILIWPCLIVFNYPLKRANSPFNLAMTLDEPVAVPPCGLPEAHFCGRPSFTAGSRLKACSTRRVKAGLAGLGEEGPARPTFLNLPPGFSGRARELSSAFGPGSRLAAALTWLGERWLQRPGLGLSGPA